MSDSLLAPLAAVATGVLVGFVMSLVGGGGSVLATPLLVYAVGVRSPHVAIGTSAIAVALNGGVSLAAHARAGAVKWRCATAFAVAGVLGALVGAALGKAFDGQKLLALFGILMIVVGAAMLRERDLPEKPDVHLTRESARELLPRLLPIGAAVGVLAGFFGVGGGFLIVPGLILATGMPIRNAIATSLVAITVFGLTTASSYAWSGLIDWPVVALLLAGGVAGAALGTAAGRRLASHRRALSVGFASFLVAVGVYVALRGAAFLF